MSDDLKRDMLAALTHRQKHGGHKHHEHCIHNLTPVEQIEARGKTVEWWTKAIGPLPEQITPDDWEIQPPEFTTISEKGPDHAE